MILARQCRAITTAGTSVSQLGEDLVQCKNVITKRTMVFAKRATNVYAIIQLIKIS